MEGDKSKIRFVDSEMHVVKKFCENVVKEMSRRVGWCNDIPVLHRGFSGYSVDMSLDNRIFLKCAGKVVAKCFADSDGSIQYGICERKNLLTVCSSDTFLDLVNDYCLSDDNIKDLSKFTHGGHEIIYGAEKNGRLILDDRAKVLGLDLMHLICDYDKVAYESSSFFREFQNQCSGMFDISVGEAATSYKLFRLFTNGKNVFSEGEIAMSFGGPSAGEKYASALSVIDLFCSECEQIRKEFENRIGLLLPGGKQFIFENAAFLLDTPSSESVVIRQGVDKENLISEVISYRPGGFQSVMFVPSKEEITTKFIGNKEEALAYVRSKLFNEDNLKLARIDARRHVLKEFSHKEDNVKSKSRK